MMVVGNFLINYIPDKGGIPPPVLNIAANASVTVGGDLVNSSVGASDFDWAGTLLFNGPGHTIEAAGEDRGPWPSGMVDNFAIATLQLAAGTVVELVGIFDNQQDGVISCDEALYIGTLILAPGAALITNGCPVYYGELQNDGGSIVGASIEDLRLVGDIDGNGCVNPFDLAMLLGAWGDCPPECDQAGPGQTCPETFDGNCLVDPFDLAQLLGNWGCE